MKTRIRHYRKLRKMTQGELAARLSTTAATISRLETAEMTVSTEWLEKLAEVFHVPVAHLIDEPREGSIPLLGVLGRDRSLNRPADAPAEDLTLEAPAAEPVAIRLADDLGAYRAGDILIADRFGAGSFAKAHGRDCLVRLASGETALGRFVQSADGSYLLVPSETAPLLDLTPVWVAPLVMVVRYL